MAGDLSVSYSGENSQCKKGQSTKQNDFTMRTAAGKAGCGFFNRSIRIIYGGFTDGAVIHRKTGLENYANRSNIGAKMKPRV
jgi:hypothetical protein